MSTGNSAPPPRPSWPYTVTAGITLALQQGWSAEQVTALTTCLLIFIALITSAGRGGE